ncbi:MAG TPA: hypothetical protein VFR25_06775 [Candidatus Eisenbacteria bacterium]|nr:hypothetical protein [Candidatus Eisenbacteria bacterium]
MNAWRGVLRSAVVGLAFLFTGGCGPRVDFLHREPDFGYPTLKQGGIAALGGVTTQGSPEGRRSLREPLSQGLETALRGERRDLTVLGVDQVLWEIGDGFREDLLDAFDRDGGLEQEDLALLDSLVGDQARYVALARVEDQWITRDEAEDESEPNETKTTVTVSLTIRVAFVVYDLQAGRSVWSATLTGSDKNSSTFTDKEQGFWATLASAVLGLDDHDDPSAPNAAGTLRKIFSKFAKELPSDD